MVTKPEEKVPGETTAKEEENASKEKSRREAEAAQKKPLGEAEDALEKTPPGEEVDPAKTSVNDDAFNSGFGKGADKARKELLKELGVKSEEDLKKLVETRADERLEKTKGRSSNELATENQRLQALIDEREKEDEQEWEKVGKVLKKANPALFEQLSTMDLPPRKKMSLAQTALPKNGKPKVGDDPLNPESKDVSPEMIAWFKKEYPLRHAKGERPTKDDIKSFNHRIKKQRSDSAS